MRTRSKDIEVMRKHPLLEPQLGDEVGVVLKIELEVRHEVLLQLENRLG